MCKATYRNAETDFISGTPGMKKQCNAFAAHLCCTSFHRKVGHALMCYTILYAH